MKQEIQESLDTACIYAINYLGLEEDKDGRLLKDGKVVLDPKGLGDALDELED